VLEKLQVTTRGQAAVAGPPLQASLQNRISSRRASWSV